MERNGDYENLRVDCELDEQEFLEMVEGLGSKSTKKKAGHKKHTSKKAVAEKMPVRKAKKKTVKFDELEDMDSDSDYRDGYDGEDDDYEEEYDGDGYDGEDDDRNVEQEYLDDMADFQG